MSLARLLADLDEYTNRELEQEIERMETDADVLRQQARTLRQILKGRTAVETPATVTASLSATVVVRPALSDLAREALESTPVELRIEERPTEEGIPAEPGDHWVDLLDEPEAEAEPEPQVDGAAAAKQAIAERKAREAKQGPTPNNRKACGVRLGAAKKQQIADTMVTYIQAAGPTRFAVLKAEINGAVSHPTMLRILEQDGRFVKLDKGLYGLKR